jgi:peroxiredoxin
MVLTESNYKLKKGDSAPDFSLLSTGNKTYLLNDFKDKPTLIIFMCNHCPYVIAKLPELNRIAEDFKDKVNVIGINSNDPDYDSEDSFENMKKYIDNGKIKFLYLADETQKTAKDYGAVCTPDPFLFDKNHKLIFHAKVDDLHRAITELINTNEITMEEKPSIGCSIKWK